jgi:hypothetical protein
VGKEFENPDDGGHIKYVSMYQGLERFLVLFFVRHSQITLPLLQSAYQALPGCSAEFGTSCRIIILVGGSRQGRAHGSHVRRAFDGKANELAALTTFCRRRVYVSLSVSVGRLYACGAGRKRGQAGAY